MAETPTTYWDYIRVEELLSLQGGLPDDEQQLTNEEVLFITVHQVYELWFKLALRELKSLRDLFTAPKVAEQQLSGAVFGLKRIQTIFQQAEGHFRLVETLHTRDYLAFRDKLMPASGFQSAQMRQIEILMGLKEEERVPLGYESSHMDALKGPGGSESPAFDRVQAQLTDLPTLKDAVDEWLSRTPIDGYDLAADPDGTQLQRFIERFLKAHAAENAIARDRAMALAQTEGDRELMQQRHAKDLAAVRAFLEPGTEEGGLRCARIRVAALFIETYRELPLLAWPREVLDGLVAVEQAFLIFRQRHARMVERVIGRRTGTGGSKGVEYLDETALRYRVFRDLWAIRTLQVRREAAPALERAEEYGFVRV